MSEIYQRLAEIAVAFRPRGPWTFLSPQADVRRLPRDTGPVLAGLREFFSDEQLAAVGLLVRNGDDQAELGFNLLSSPRIFVVLRAAADQTPNDILGPCGSLAGHGAPALTAAADAYTAQQLRNWRKWLFVTFDIRALAILRILGLPATLADGLDRLDGAALRGLLGPPRALPQDPTRLQPPGCTQGAALWNAVDKLVLVGWSITRLNARKPRGLQAVAALFGGARHCFNFDTSRIAVWRPTNMHLAQIKLAVRLQDVDLVQQTIAHGLDASVRRIEDFADNNPGVPARQAYQIARQNLRQELQREQEQRLLSLLVPRLLAAYNCAFERAIVEPIVVEALSADSPIDRAVMLAAAELLQDFHNTSPMVTGCTEHTSRTRVPWSVPMDLEVLKRRLRTVDRLLAIWRERRK